MYNISKTCQISNLDKIYQKYFGYPSQGYFVEVGAYDGEYVSNTSCLADHGWRGLYIEPILTHYTMCLKRHENNNVLVYNAAIGEDEGEKLIYYGDTLSTLNKEQVDRYSEIDWAKSTNFQECSCYQMRLDTLMEKVGTPKQFEVLVVDVEGKESEVFRSFDLKVWKPKMIIVELEDEHPSFQNYPDLISEVKQLREFILENKYQEIYKDYVNTIFVSSDFDSLN